MSVDRVPTAADVKAATREWDSQHHKGAFAELPTRKRNALARDAMFHREFADLSAAIMGTRPKGNTVTKTTKIKQGVKRSSQTPTTPTQQPAAPWAKGDVIKLVHYRHCEMMGAQQFMPFIWNLTYNEFDVRPPALGRRWMRVVASKKNPGTWLCNLMCRKGGVDARVRTLAVKAATPVAAFVKGTRKLETLQ